MLQFQLLPVMERDFVLRFPSPPNKRANKTPTPGKGTSKKIKVAADLVCWLNCNKLNFFHLFICVWIPVCILPLNDHHHQNHLRSIAIDQGQIWWWWISIKKQHSLSSLRAEILKEIWSRAITNINIYSRKRFNNKLTTVSRNDKAWLFLCLSSHRFVNQPFGLSIRQLC